MLKSFASQFYEALKDPSVRQELSSIIYSVIENDTNVNEKANGQSSEEFQNNENDRNESFTPDLGVMEQNLKTEYENKINALSQEFEKKMREQASQYEKKFSAQRSDHDSTINDLKAKIDSYSAGLKAAEDEVRLLQSEISNRNSQLEKMNEKINYYEESYDKYERALAVLKSMSEDTRNSLENYFPYMTVESVVAAGGDRICVEGMWEFVKFRVLDHNNRDLEALTEVMVFLFDVYKSHNRQTAFELFSPDIGSEYDKDIAINRLSASSGSVKTVLMPGYRNMNTGKIIKKAVVEV